MNKVFLVGAGPGDPDLLTLKAARLLSKADVVLHDALVSPAVLALIRSGAEIIDIGKRCGRKLLTQSEINDLLIAHARANAIVVRLKGGDPSIFGRAGEEISALLDAGIEFEIVPGITTALAAAASAKISLTDRRFASAVTLLTANRDRERPTDWDRLVTSGATVAIYMPGRDYAELATNLLHAGLSRRTPCTVISNVSLSSEARLFTTIEGLQASHALPAPSFVFVGQCAAPAQSLELPSMQAAWISHEMRPEERA